MKTKKKNNLDSEDENNSDVKENLHDKNINFDLNINNNNDENKKKKKTKV